MTLPHDYTFCTGTNCRLRESCRRYAYPVPPGVYVSMMAPPADPDECEAFLSIGKAATSKGANHDQLP